MNKMIFEPLEIGTMTLKNRIGLAPLLNMPDVWTTFSITDRTIRWFEEKYSGSPPGNYSLRDMEVSLAEKYKAAMKSFLKEL